MSHGSPPASPDLELVLALVEHVPAMLAYWDAEQRCRFANRAYETWFDVDPRQLLGRHLSELLGPIYPLNLPYIERALRGEPQQFERDIPDPRGGPPRHSQAQYIPHVVGGTVRGFFVLVADISARVRAEELARAAQRDLASTFEDAPIGMGIVGLEGRWIRVNRVLTQLLGYESAELQGMTFQDVTHADDVQTDVAHVERLLRGEALHYSMEKRYVRRDGCVVPVMLHVSLVRDDRGQPKHFISQIEDLTARKQLQEQVMLADRLTTVGTLAAGVAHEINNPLAYIVANLEYLQERLPNHVPVDPDGAATLVAEARDGAERVRRIVADLNTFARSPMPAARPVDVVRAVQVAVRMTSAETRPRATLTVTHDADVPWVFGDDTMLSQVFINLLVNAAYAVSESRREGAEIRVSIRRASTDHVAVDVSDTGRGMTAEVRRRAFEPFFTTKRIGEGTGLGLSICRNIVTSFGGDISLESTEGEGTTVRVQLRAAERATTPASDKSRRLRDGSAPSG